MRRSYSLQRGRARPFPTKCLGCVVSCDPPRRRHSKERSKQITCQSSAAYYSQFTWVSSWPASLGGPSRNIATTTLRQLIATLDIWMQSGTGVSRKPSESVFSGLVLRRAGGASARHRPTKVCDWVQVRWPRSRASGKHCEKNRFNFRDFSDVFKFFKFSGP